MRENNFKALAEDAEEYLKETEQPQDDESADIDAVLDEVEKKLAALEQKMNESGKPEENEEEE